VTELDLAAIGARVDQATSGPWWAWDRGVGWCIAVGSPVDVDECGRPADYLPAGDRTDIERREDAEFIAAARHDVPALAAEVERLQRLLGAGPFPSSEAFENAMQAVADLRALLADVLHAFPHTWSAAGRMVRSEWVPTETLERWRSHLGGGS
jgi:hypothetical protein